MWQAEVAVKSALICIISMNHYIKRQHHTIKCLISPLPQIHHNKIINFQPPPPKTTPQQSHQFQPLRQTPFKQQFYQHQMTQQFNITHYTTKESNPIVQSYKLISNKLELQHAKIQFNELKIKDLVKKVSCLDLLNRHSQRQSMKYQRQLDKLEATQQYATELLKLKYQSFRDMELGNNQRYNNCLTQRTRMARNRQLSMSLFEQKKSERIRRSRDEKEKVLHDLQRSYRDLANQTKQQSQEVKLQQQRIRDRKHRYEMFKMQRAANNYQQKMEAEYEQLKEKSRFLQELKLKAHKAEHIFRKTQMLEKEASKIQSIYLTDH